MRLYTLGDIAEDAIKEEAADLRRQREFHEGCLAGMRQPKVPDLSSVNQDHLLRIAEMIREWLRNASQENRALALEALQVSVRATREEATVSGFIPLEAPSFITEHGTSRCSFNGD